MTNELNNLATVTPLPVKTGPIERALAGERLDREALLELYTLPAEEVRSAAHQIRLRQTDEELVTYSLYGNIDYTNVCSVGCQFCCYFRAPRAVDAFTLSLDEIAAETKSFRDEGVDNILLMGGINPSLPLSWYVDVLQTIKSVHPDIWIDAFSPEEIFGLERLTGRDVTSLLSELKAAGMDALPGVSAEILIDEVRHRVAPNRIPTADWFRIVDAALAVGMDIPCVSMVFGMGETVEQNVDHLIAVRDFQDRALEKYGSGFRTFEVWPMRLQHTRLRDSAITIDPDEIAADYLHHLAVARLTMDNIAHHRSVWRTMGFGVAAAALQSGADELSGTGTINAITAATELDGRVIDGPGTKDGLLGDIRQCIVDSGFTPARRGPTWNILSVDRPDSAETEPLFAPAGRVPVGAASSNGHAERGQAARQS